MTLLISSLQRCSLSNGVTVQVSSIQHPTSHTTCHLGVSHPRTRRTSTHDQTHKTKKNYTHQKKQRWHKQNGALADISHSALCCHSNETLEGTPYHSPKLHPGPCSSVGMRRGTDRQPWPVYISPRLRIMWNVMRIGTAQALSNGWIPRCLCKTFIVPVLICDCETWSTTANLHALIDTFDTGLSVRSRGFLIILVASQMWNSQQCSGCSGVSV